jgi:hypothetical protein
VVDIMVLYNLEEQEEPVAAVQVPTELQQLAQPEQPIPVAVVVVVEVMAAQIVQQEQAVLEDRAW